MIYEAVLLGALGGFGGGLSRGRLGGDGGRGGGGGGGDQQGPPTHTVPLQNCRVVPHKPAQRKGVETCGQQRGCRNREECSVRTKQMYVCAPALCV